MYLHVPGIFAVSPAYLRLNPVLMDINGLIYGKMKAKLTQQDLTEYYKFMGFYSDGDYSINAVHSIVKIYVFMVSDEEQSA